MADHNDDDASPVYAETEEEVNALLNRWLTEEETRIEREAAETGKPVNRDMAMADDETGKVHVRLRLTCEPGQFAKRTLEFASGIKIDTSVRIHDPKADN
jgi:hypothetical protein